MEIAEQLQHEAEHRAGSPEGFLQVIRLVLNDMEERVEQPTLLSPFSLPCRPEWREPSEYLPIFREYVCLMQESIQLKRQAIDLETKLNELHRTPSSPNHIVYTTTRLEFAKTQKQLSETLHEARRKQRELPVHALKRLRAIETRCDSRYGRGKMYLPVCWSQLSELVETYISRWGQGREEQRWESLKS